MARSRSAAVRVVLTATAIVAILAMHGSAAQAHSCGAGRAETADHHGSDEHEHHDAEGSGASGDLGGDSRAAHCAPLACAAVVTSERVPAPQPPTRGTAVRLTPDEPLAGAPATPDPPVPRRLLHV